MKLMKKTFIAAIASVLALFMMLSTGGSGLFGAADVQAAEIVKSGKHGDSINWTLDSEGVLTLSGSGEIDSLFTEVREETKKVVIQDGITGIGNNAFQGYRNMTDVVLPDSLTYIGDYAFFQLKKLENITIPETVTDIGKMAFDECEGLTEITVPASVKNIGEQAFGKCKSLKNIKLSEGLISIGDYAFCNDNGLTTIVIPDSVTSIGKSAFIACKNLESIKLPSGITSVEDFMFHECEKLKSIEIPEGVTTIGKHVFFYCKELTEMTIPVSVTSIGDQATVVCDKLSDIYYGGTKEQWQAVDISDVSNGNAAIHKATIHYKGSDDTSSGEESPSEPDSSSGGSSTPSKILGGFPDVTASSVNATSYKSIYWAVDNGIVKGYADGTFKPEVICTREQFSIMLWRFANEPDSDISSVEKFTDASSFSNNTAKKAVAWAVEEGIVAGFSDGSFKPQENINRAQVAVMLWRFAGKPSPNGSGKFSDIADFTSGVQNAIIWEEGAGIAAGYKDGTFQPDGGCQRQHMAIFLNRYNSNVEKYK